MTSESYVWMGQPAVSLGAVFVKGADLTTPVAEGEASARVERVYGLARIDTTSVDDDGEEQTEGTTVTPLVDDDIGGFTGACTLDEYIGYVELPVDFSGELPQQLAISPDAEEPTQILTASGLALGARVKALIARHNKRCSGIETLKPVGRVIDFRQRDDAKTQPAPPPEEKVDGPEDQGT